MNILVSTSSHEHPCKYFFNTRVKTGNLNEKRYCWCTLINYCLEWNLWPSCFYYFSMCFYKEVHVKKYLQGCSCEEVLTRMFMWRSTYKDVHVKKYLQGCSCEEVLTRMFIWSGSTSSHEHPCKYFFTWTSL
jgi:hypothetical protein